MKSFTQYLTESRSAPLYHGTSIGRFEDIYDQKMIKGATEHQHEVVKGKAFDNYRPWPRKEGAMGISLSRSFAMSARFGPIVLELDQAKLIQTHKVVPLNYAFSTDHSVATAARSLGSHPYHGTEFEEFVRGSILDLDKYLITIWVPEGYLLPIFADQHPWMKDPRIKGYKTASGRFDAYAKKVMG